MVKKINLVAIDTEFNTRGDLLSLGLANHEFKTDFFVKNKVDKRSFVFHGLSEDFLKENGMDKNQIKKAIISLEEKFDIIIGFNILKDLQVLGLKKISLLYENKKIIDIKCVLDLYRKKHSLVSLAKILDIKVKNSALEHSSSYDAMLTYSIFLKFLELEMEDDKTYMEIIDNLASLSRAYFCEQRYEIDRMCSFFENIESRLTTMVRIDSKAPITSYFMKNGFICFLDSNKEAKYRFPHKYVEEDKLDEYELIKDNNSNVSGVKFFEKVLSKNFKSYSYMA